MLVSAAAAAVIQQPPCAAATIRKSNPNKSFHQIKKEDSIFRVIKSNQFYYNSSSALSVKCCCSSGGNSLSQENQENAESKGLWQKWKERSGEMSGKLAKLGLAAVLAYGIFDGVTYTCFFVLAFLGYEKSTGKNPAANLQALLGIVIMMWAGNNVTRPFRVAGAAALAPAIDKALKRIQKYFNFPTVAYAFAVVVGIVAGTCLTVAGLLILSRWGK